MIFITADTAVVHCSCAITNIPSVVIVVVVVVVIKVVVFMVVFFFIVDLGNCYDIRRQPLHNAKAKVYRQEYKGN